MKSFFYEARYSLNRLPQWFRVLLVFAFLFFLTLYVGWRFIQAHAPLSYQDEYVYIDAVDKATRWQLNRQNAKVDSYAIHELACRGVEKYGMSGGSCAHPYGPDRLPYYGYSTASVHSPVYFYVTAWLSEAIMMLRPATSLILAARLTGVLWASLGLACLYYIVRILAGSRQVAIGATLLMLAAPQLRWASFYVTPDALSLFAGASILLSTILLVRSHCSPIWLISLSIIMALVKFQMLFMVGACFLFLLAMRFFDFHENRKRLTRPLVWCLISVILGLGAQAAYQILRSWWALPAPPSGTMDPEGSYSLMFAAEQIDNFLLPIYTGNSAADGLGPIHWWVNVAAILLVATLLATAFMLPSINREGRILACSLLFSMVFLGPLFYTYINLSTGTFFDLNPRYAGTLQPALFVGLPFTVDRPKIRSVFMAFAIVIFVIAVGVNDAR